jgi:hypothetical protein
MRVGSPLHVHRVLRRRWRNSFVIMDTSSPVSDCVELSTVRRTQLLLMISSLLLMIFHGTSSQTQTRSQCHRGPAVHRESQELVDHYIQKRSGGFWLSHRGGTYPFLRL